MANQKFQNAVARVAQKTPPVWMMRQAGRYHRHYQALRAKHSFMELCKDPKLAAQVALGPIEDFDFDVSILFSDLLFPLEALGMGLEYKDTGPALGWHLTDATVKNLIPHTQAISQLEFQADAVRLTREVLPKDKSLIGFVGGPWTLFVYAVEGGHAGSLIKSKCSLDLYRKFCDQLLPLLEKNIKLQLDAGAELVMLFDTAAGEVSPEFYQKRLAADLANLFRKFPGKLGYYSKSTQPAHFSQGLLQTPGLTGFGVDHRWNLSGLLADPTRQGFLQGNFDQALLFLEPELFAEELRAYLAPMVKLAPEQRLGWICGLGHGVLPKTPEENVRNFVRIVREMFR